MTTGTKTQEVSVQAQLESVTMLLGAVLLMINEPVYVSKDLIRHGMPNGGRISVIDNVEDDEYVLTVEEPDA